MLLRFTPRSGGNDRFMPMARGADRFTPIGSKIYVSWSMGNEMFIRRMTALTVNTSFLCCSPVMKHWLKWSRANIQRRLLLGYCIEGSSQVPEKKATSHSVFVVVVFGFFFFFSSDMSLLFLLDLRNCSLSSSMLGLLRTRKIKPVSLIIYLPHRKHRLASENDSLSGERKICKVGAQSTKQMLTSKSFATLSFSTVFVHEAE